MNLLNKGSIYVAFLIMVFQAAALDLSKINLAYQYDPKAGIHVNYRLVNTDGTVRLLTEIQKDSQKKWELDLLLQESYLSEEHDTLQVIPDTIMTREGGEILSLNLPPSGNSRLLILVFSNLESQEYLLFDFPIPPIRSIPEFYPVDMDGYPIIGNFTHLDTLVFTTTAPRMFAFRYEENFGPADPPMGEMKALAPSLSIDSVFSFGDTLTGLENYHFYLFQTDTLEERAITLLKCPSYYPEYRALEELIDPLTYITTETESKSIHQSSNPKKAFEMFWLNTYDTKLRAKSAIRSYYQMIENANLLFTDYKQGWKTDRGIIFTIFGPPDVVLKSERSEIWRYDEGPEFEFIKISTLFTSSLYSLKRSRDYDTIWYNQVGEIRKGQ